MFTNLLQIHQITIWGVGLIGGSLGLALQANGFPGKRVGLGRRLSTLKRALERGAVDSITTHFEEGLGNAELVVIGTPVEQVPVLVQRIAESTAATRQRSIVITDVGSTKAEMVKAVEARLCRQKGHPIIFVGGHPMAGSHETGVNAARANLFENAKCILTPTEDTPPHALRLLENLWQFTGAVPHILSPEVHDLLIGAASHLPHLIASVLTNSVAGLETDAGKALDFTATGFRDTTRIAAGSPEMWTQIFAQNREVLSLLIDNIVDNLMEFKDLLQTKNTAEIERVLMAAKKSRDPL